MIPSHTATTVDSENIILSFIVNIRYKISEPVKFRDADRKYTSPIVRSSEGRAAPVISFDSTTINAYC